MSSTTLLDRMVIAVEKVRDRVRRVAQALEAAGLDYAVIGGNAVAAWVATVDEAAVRNTADVDVMIRRSDFDAVKRALEAEGFVYRHVAHIDMFLDGGQAKARDAVHIIYAGEKVTSDDLIPSPDVICTEDMGQFRALALDALVQAKLTSFRLKDQVHLQDMVSVGLIDESWLERVPAVLALRLKQVLDNPEA